MSNTRRIKLGKILRLKRGTLEEFPADFKGWIEVEEKQPGVFAVVGNNITVVGGDPMVDQTEFGFTKWDSQVDNIATDDELYLAFKVSTYVRWRNAYITPSGIKAPNFEHAVEAFRHMTVCTYCPGDL